MCSQWCNYECSYCWQEHSRKQIFRGSPGHWRDVRPPAEWLNALLRHFPKPISLHVTGGETLMDKAAGKLFQALLIEGWSITVDTNGSFSPTMHSIRVPLMVSYHPEHVTLDAWLQQIIDLQKAGWPVMNGAYVARPDYLDEFRAARDGLATLKLPINVAPVNFSWAGFTTAEVTEISRHIPLAYRAGMPTYGEICRFPSQAYEMDPDGTIFVACHRRPQQLGSIWNESLPEVFVNSVPCPKQQCTCEDKFLFIDKLKLTIGASAKQTYSEMLPCG